jgi:hypothetical protein
VDGSEYGAAAIINQEEIMEPEKTSSSKVMLWIGYTISTLAILFLLMDAVMKLIKPEMVVDLNKKLGFAEAVITPIAIVLLLCTLLYAFPKTSVLGAILLTGYLGGAVATHVRVSAPEQNHGFGGEPFSIVFPVIIGALLWGGLYLRDARLQALIPLKK